MVKESASWEAEEGGWEKEEEGNEQDDERQINEGDVMNE